MFLALFLFFLDLAVFNFFDTWLLFSLLSYWITILLSVPSTRDLHQGAWLFRAFVLFLVVLQDFVVHGRLGVALCYLIPVYLGARVMRKLFPEGAFLPYAFLLFTGLIGYFFLVKGLVLRQEVAIGSTSLLFLGNMILMIVSLKMRGMRGNRSL